MKNYLAVLSAGVKKNKDGKWVSTDLAREDEKLGAPGGKLRIRAAVYLFGKGGVDAIIASGGRGRDIVNDEPGRPDLSAIMKRELVESGIPEDRIIEENKSNKTFDQLKEIKKITGSEKLNKTFIITSEYHLARVRAIMEYDAGLEAFFAAGRLTPVSAEEICLKYDREKWQDIIKAAYQSEEFKNRIKAEERGIKDIKAGKYKFS
jgi:hypothetical protein